MALLPIIKRELLSESRHAFTYWLRFYGAAALLVVGGLVFLDGHLPSSAGGKLFQSLHLTLFVSIWIIAALMTADCISRERREGTLGLLFLTPLRPIEVVAAKGFAHGLRALSVCIAAIPALVVPFLMGGVSWRHVTAAVLINLSALCWALAAGILASSICRRMTRALVLTAILEAVGFLVFVRLQGAALISAASASAWWPRSADRWDFESWSHAGGLAISRTDQVMSLFSKAGSPSFVSRWLLLLGGVVVASILVCFISAWIAAINIRSAVREKGPSVAMAKVEKEFCTPAFALGFFRCWMRRILERNPVGWLERRTWQGRLVTWSWIAVMVSFIIGGVGQGFSDGDQFQALMRLVSWLLIASVTFTAAGSLRRERESGVIELLLVSPLSVAQIIGGRLRGIGGQFLPATILLVASWLWLTHAFSNTLLAKPDAMTKGFVWIGFFAVTLFTIPVTGLYYSLRCESFVVGVFLTAALGLAIPWCVSQALWALMPPDVDAVFPQWARAMMGTLIAGAALVLGHFKVAGSRGLSLGLAAGLGLVGLVCVATCTQEVRLPGDDRLLPTVTTCAALEIGVAVLLGSRLKRRLERREFAMPR
ncbi:MAG: hypothetical protein QOF48_2284 [Verrucomicrobiota bacterium]|jgi:ABC-type Na+ efflux pump permease subunit